MATSLEEAINKDFLSSVLPTYGNPRVQIPVWDNSQKMFICNEYESANGHRYYCGVRFCDRVVIVEKVGHYHSWTYIDGIELYAFNGKRLQLIQKREYDKEYREADFVRAESERMITDYLLGMQKVQHVAIPTEEVEKQAKELTEKCYKSYLDDDFDLRLTQIIPAIDQR